jgi:hypothetical protein
MITTLPSFGNQFTLLVSLFQTFVTMTEEIEPHQTNRGLLADGANQNYSKARSDIEQV